MYREKKGCNWRTTKAPLPWLKTISSKGRVSSSENLFLGNQYQRKIRERERGPSEYQMVEAPICDLWGRKVWGAGDESKWDRSSWLQTSAMANNHFLGRKGKFIKKSLPRKSSPAENRREREREREDPMSIRWLKPQYVTYEGGKYEGLEMNPNGTGHHGCKPQGLSLCMCQCFFFFPIINSYSRIFSW